MEYMRGITGYQYNSRPGKRADRRKSDCEEYSVRLHNYGLDLNSLSVWRISWCNQLNSGDPLGRGKYVDETDLRWK